MTATSCAWVGVLLLTAAGLTCSPPEQPPAQENVAVRHGRQIFLALSCPTCHGHDRSGTNIGPPILKLRNHWTEERLVQFLRDPASFKQADTRLRQISERYRTDMPSAILGDNTKLKALVAFLLAE
jgi:cytochrome c2